MAFGGVAVDQKGPTRDFPAASMLTGLAANALGWHWSDRAAHDALQSRLIFAARHEHEPSATGVVRDMQNAQLSGRDREWTTFGVEGRAGASYGAPHRRMRDYLADRAVRLVLRLHPVDLSPTLETLAEALDRPARPLFIGRKPCIPSCRLVEGWVDGDTAHAALSSLSGSGSFPALWPAGEGPEAGELVERMIDLPDIRNWKTGLHGGSRLVVEGVVKGLGDS